MIGERDSAKIGATIANCHGLGLPPFAAAVSGVSVESVRARESQFYESDPVGFFVVYPDRRTSELVVEHYTNAGVLDCVVTGPSATAVYAEVVERKLVSQLDHAAYLGRELAIAERSLRTGEPYVQDRAPGDPMPVRGTNMTDGCGPECTSCH